MYEFKVGDQVFPVHSQRLPAYTVAHVGAVMITIIDSARYRELVHRDDIVLRDPAVQYSTVQYDQFE